MIVWHGPRRYLGARFGNAAGCICCMGCTGPILMIIGIVFLVNAVVDTRSSLISQYNTAVDNWSNQYRAAFANASGFQYTSATISGSFVNSTSADTLNDYAHSGETFKSYTPYKFTASSVLPVTPGVYSYNLVIMDKANNTLYNNAALSTVYTSTVSVSCTTDEAKKYTSTSSCKASKCSNSGGSYSYTTNTCTITKYANSVCFLVQAGGVGWTQSGGGGCFYGSNGIVTASASAPVYTVPGEIRSSKDPYVVASSLTSGSLYFGLTAAQNAAIGTSLMVIGVVFTAGVILCIIGTTQCVTEWAVGRGYNNYVPIWRTGAYVANPPPPTVYVQGSYGMPATQGPPPMGYASPPPGYQPTYTAPPPQVQMEGESQPYDTAPPPPRETYSHPPP